MSDDGMAFVAVLDRRSAAHAVNEVQAKLAEAEQYFQQALDSSRRRSGSDHADTLLAILRMATLRVAQGQSHH